MAELCNDDACHNMQIWMQRFAIDCSVPDACADMATDGTGNTNVWGLSLHVPTTRTLSSYGPLRARTLTQSPPLSHLSPLLMWTRGCFECGVCLCCFCTAARVGVQLYIRPSLPVIEACVVTQNLKV